MKKSEVGKTINRFSRRMQLKMEKRDDKNPDGWRVVPLSFMYRRLSEEVGELAEALISSATYVQIVDEAVDVANCAMMLADIADRNREGLVMPCMCGDLYCWSCGPAQGNYKCPNCRAWTGDGGCEDPVACMEAIDASAQAEAEAEKADAKEEADAQNEEFRRRGAK